MNRAIRLTGLLAAALLIGACEHKVDNVGDYNPALDGPSLPPSPVISSALLDGKAGGGGETPAPKPPTPTPPAATATAPSDTAATAPGETPATTPVEAAGAPSADAVKAEIDGRLDQIKQLLTDGKYDEFEKAGYTPEEWKAKTDADAQAFQKEVDKDKADPVKAAANIDSVTKAVKGAKPTVSADGTLATYHFGPDAPAPAFVFKKVDGVWYPSESETMKALGMPAASAPAPTPPAP